jgi:hypothetical protein
MTNAAESGSTNPSYDRICSLLEKSAYDPTAIPLLEAYVNAQVVEDAPYSFDANRTLAKLYLFFPQLAVDNKIEVSMALILFLALLQYPFSSDFLALSCLISERVQGKEPCTTLIRYVDRQTVVVTQPSSYPYSAHPFLKKKKNLSLLSFCCRVFSVSNFFLYLFILFFQMLQVVGKLSIH